MLLCSAGEGSPRMYRTDGSNTATYQLDGADRHTSNSKQFQHQQEFRISASSKTLETYKRIWWRRLGPCNGPLQRPPLQRPPLQRTTFAMEHPCNGPLATDPCNDPPRNELPCNGPPSQQTTFATGPFVTDPCNNSPCNDTLATDHPCNGPLATDPCNDSPCNDPSCNGRVGSNPTGSSIAPHLSPSQPCKVRFLRTQRAAVGHPSPSSRKLPLASGLPGYNRVRHFQAAFTSPIE